MFIFFACQNIQIINISHLITHIFVAQCSQIELYFFVFASRSLQTADSLQCSSVAASPTGGACECHSMSAAAQSLPAIQHRAFIARWQLLQTIFIVLLPHLQLFYAFFMCFKWAAKRWWRERVYKKCKRSMKCTTTANDAQQNVWDTKTTTQIIWK